MKQINIEVPKGYEIDEENSSFSCIKFKEKQVSCWEDLGGVTGYVVSTHSEIDSCTGGGLYTISANRNVFSSEEQAKASIALAQLSQLVAYTNKGWVPDWGDSTYKHLIYINANIPETSMTMETKRFLAFADAHVRDSFLKNHLTLIEQAKPLL